jgi:hypothetical protein
MLPFRPEFVFAGIGEFTTVLKEGVDYQRGRQRDGVRHGARSDCSTCTPDAHGLSASGARRLRQAPQETRTINEWDSQYQLHSQADRRDPPRPGEDRALCRRAGTAARQQYGLNVAGQGADRRNVGALGSASGKIDSDVSAAALLLQDEHGRRYLHRPCRADRRNRRIRRRRQDHHRGPGVAVMRPDRSLSRPAPGESKRTASASSPRRC